MVKPPEACEVDELNRVLIAVAELGIQGKGCTARSVMGLCSSFTLGGRPVDHWRVLKVCDYAGLARLVKRRVKLTADGREFLSLNPAHSYELTEEQEQFVAERLILLGPWRSRARDLFLSFRPNHSRVTYEYVLYDSPLPLRLSAFTHLLKRLRVVVEEDSVLSVVPAYVAAVRQVLADRSGTTEGELGRALIEKQRLCTQAEEAVVAYECRRLKLLGRPIEASSVRRISHLNVGAGYDIESYDGDKPLFDYDRFIEVKASQREELRFHWTANERRIAEQLRARYWIYYVGGFDNSRAHEIAPVMIQDPASRLPHMAQLCIESSAYIVSQSEELTLRLADQQGIQGYLL